MKHPPHRTVRVKPTNFKFELCMPKRNNLISVFVFIVVCAFLFENFYSEAKKNAVRQLNEEQLIHAKQAAHGIEEYFATWKGILASFAKMDEIIQGNSLGQRDMDLFYEAHKEQISSVTRVDEKGTILYTVPYKESIGSNISGQAHMREILENHKPVISDVFKSVQSFDCVALHVPVFKGAQFKGTLAIVINFQALSKRYLEVIKIGKTGHAWVISRDGTELYSPVPGDIGKSVFENYKDFPSILAMTKEMLKGNEGVATYTAYETVGRKTAPVLHHAVYMPINLGNTFWSIVVGCSEKEVLSALASFRNKLFMIMGFILLGGVFFSTILVKAWVIVSEEKKRKHIEEELRSSEARFHLLIERAPDAIVVYDVDLDHFVEANPSAEKLFSCSRDELLRSGPQRFYFPEQPDQRELTETFPEHNDRVLAGEEIQFERAVRTAEGKDLLCEVRLVRLPHEDRRLIRASFIDITKRKRAEKDLVESERRFRTLFEQAAVGVAEIDPLSGRFIHVNRRYCHIVGLTMDEILNTDFQSITHPEDIENDLSHMRSLIAGDINEYSIDKRYIRKDGGVVWVSLTVYPTWLPGESPTRHIAIVEDITERKKAEDALRAERNFSNAVLHSLPSVFYLYDENLTFLRWNERLEQVLGYSGEEIVRLSPLDFFAGADRELVAARIQEVFDKGAAEVEANFVAKNGTCMPYYFTGVMTTIAGRRCLLGVGIDITERKQAEELRRIRETYFSQVFDTVRDIIFIVGIEPDDTFRFTSVNRMFLEITGLSESQVIGKTVEEIIPEPSSILVLEKYREAVQGRLPVHWQEVSVYPAGEKFGEVTVTPVFDATGKCTQLIGTVHDITDLKRAQEELEQKVVERTRELSEANIRLTGLDRLKSMFIASMSHELRTPLNSIIGFTGMTLQGLSGELNDEQKDNISRVYQAAKHLLSLISDIIDISKIEAGRIDVFPEAVSLKEIIAEAIETVKPQLKEKGLALEVDVPGDVRLNTDRMRLLQCLLNFLSNAVKFTESGTIMVAARETDGRVMISVSDTGIGIAEKDMPKLFEAFERLETHLRVKAGGTGLGLYLTKKLTKDILHGDVSVQSKEGQGSTFTLRVPKDLRQNFDIADIPDKTGDIG